MTSISSRFAGVWERNRFLFLAAGVLLLAAAMRLIALRGVPPGLAQDEVLNADIVSFIRQGERALFFREGYGHEPLYHYYATPFQWLLGDNMLSIRLPPAFLGLLLVAATMRWVKREFGKVAAVAAGLGLAVSWWPIIFSRVGIRPILEPLLLVCMAWFWPRRPCLAGLLLGLSVYSYTAARVVFLIPVLMGGYTMLVHGRTRKGAGGVRPAVIVLLTTVLVYLPLALTLHFDPTLQERVRQLAGPLTALSQGDVKPVLETTWATLGVFSFTGDPRWTYTLPGRPFFDPLTAVLFYGGLGLAMWRWRRPRYAFALIWLIVGLIPSAVTPQAPSTIRLVGAMPVVFLIPALAVSWLWERAAVASTSGEGGAARQRVVVAMLAAVFFLNLGRTVLNGFIRWPAALETRMKYQKVLYDIGQDLQQSGDGPMVVTEGFFEPIDADSLRRDIGQEMDVRWVQTGQEVAGALVFPDSQGEDMRLYVPEYAPPDPALMTMAGIGSRPLYRSEETPSFSVYALPPEPPAPSHPLMETFDGVITLLGYELKLPEERPLQIFTIWRVEAVLPQDLAIFVHLLAPAGQIFAQHDGLDAAPQTLHPGDIVIQRHLLFLPGSLSLEGHTLQLGLYTRSDGRRLTRTGDPADRVILGDNWFLTERE
ncbi:MAG: ArnT family glycosyltransferase [Anaerolineae bacterium]